MCFILQGIRFQVQVLKPCKFVLETSEEVLVFKVSSSSVKAMQVCPRNKWRSASFYLIASIYQGLKVIEARSSTANLIDGYLSRFMNLSFSELFFIQSVSICLSFFFSQP